MSLVLRCKIEENKSDKSTVLLSMFAETEMLVNLSFEMNDNVLNEIRDQLSDQTINDIELKHARATFTVLSKRGNGALVMISSHQLSNNKKLHRCAEVFTEQYFKDKKNVTKEERERLTSLHLSAILKAVVEEGKEVEEEKEEKEPAMQTSHIRFDDELGIATKTTREIITTRAIKKRKLEFEDEDYLYKQTRTGRKY